jgi:hypothetical protein
MSTHPTPAGPTMPAGPSWPAGPSLPTGPNLPAGPTPSAGPARPAAGPETRASDADRDAAAGLLNEAFAEGRLTADEHDQRLSAAYAARSWPQLHQLTADLPAAPDAAAVPMAPRMPAGVDPCLLCVLLIVCPPAGIAYWLLSRRRLPLPAAGTRGQVGLHAQDR